MEHLELVKPNHPPEIVQRLIDLGMISGDKSFPLTQRIKRNGPR
jgi:Fe2+ transport system protein FeoA